ncbi:MAG TPA: polyprenol monophosphomannose synthase [Acidimicrobiia bacterium]|nr:polyprenol monophosphomannose synthase [Acidimicrobiia bacterium]
MLPEQVTVVVPTYNERENLPHMAAAVLLHGYRLIVVDDNSPDGTGSLADELAAATPGLEVIHRPSKQGLGPAYGQGFRQALDGGADVVVQMDCDFSHNPNDIPRLVAAVEAGADLGLGSRYVPGGDTPDWPWHRKFLSRGGNIYARIMLGIPIRDATGGFRAWTAPGLMSLPFEAAEASGYGFQVEMAMRAVDQGLKVEEVPIVFRDRARGYSKMGLDIVFEAMRLVTVWGLRRRTSWLRFRT